MPRTWLTCVLALCAAVLSTTTAGAAGTQTVSRSSPTAAFDGKGGAGTYLGVPAAESQLPECLPQDVDCETTLVDVRDLGEVRFSLEENDSTELVSVSLSVYRSDASGTRGSRVGHSGPYGRKSVIVPDAQSVVGHYLFVARWFEGVGNYRGSITLTPRAAPPD